MAVSAAALNAAAESLAPGGRGLADELFVGTVGTKAGGSTVQATEGGVRFNQTVITFTNTPITMVDDGVDECVGSMKVYDFPAGAILFFGACADLAVVKSGSGINADFDGDFSVGTAVAAADPSLTSTEADIIASTATPQAVAGATTAKAFASGAGINSGSAFDGTTTAKDMYLSFLIDYGDQSGGGTLLVTGTLTVSWLNVGDI